MTLNAYWTIVLVAFVLALLGGEFFALRTERSTFSRYVWEATKAWPPLPLVVGVVLGFLCSHFWWGGHLICY